MARYAELAYLAGMIDGEGYIGIEMANPQGHERSVRHARRRRSSNNARRFRQQFRDMNGGASRGR